MRKQKQFFGMFQDKRLIPTLAKLWNVNLDLGNCRDGILVVTDTVVGTMAEQSRELAGHKWPLQAVVESGWVGGPCAAAWGDRLSVFDSPWGASDCRITATFTCPEVRFYCVPAPCRCLPHMQNAGVQNEVLIPTNICKLNLSLSSPQQAALPDRQPVFPSPCLLKGLEIPWPPSPGKQQHQCTTAL